MKSLLFFSSLILSAFSQTISILSPTPDATAASGQNMTVQLGFANSLTGVEHVSVVISMINCIGQPCPTDASSTLGIPLFMGNYTPEFHEQSLPPYQNFTVTVPEATSAGTNLLTVAHFMLLGASSEPILEFKNTTVTTPSTTRRAIRGRVVPV